MRVRIPIAVTLAAVIAVSSLGINTVSAAPVAAIPAAWASVGTDTEFIQVAAKKRRSRANDAAAAAAFMGIVGGIIALSAQESRRDRYYDRGHYYKRGYHGNYYGGRGPAYQPRPFRGSPATPYGPVDPFALNVRPDAR